MYKNLYLLGLLLLTNGAITGVTGEHTSTNGLRSRELQTSSSSPNTRDLGIVDSIVCGIFGGCDDNQDKPKPDKKNETKNVNINKNDTLLDGVFGDGGIIDQILDGGDDNNDTKKNTTKKNETTSNGSDFIDSVFDFVNDILNGSNKTDGSWNWTWGKNDTNFGDGDYNNTSFDDLWNGNGTIIDGIFGNNTNITNWLNATFGDGKNPVADFINKFLGNLLGSNTTDNGKPGDLFFINNLLSNLFNNTTDGGKPGDLINNLLGNLLNNNSDGGKPSDFINNLLSNLLNNTDGADWLNGTLFANGTGGLLDGIFGNITNILDGFNSTDFVDGFFGGDAIRNASTVSAFVGDWFDEANFVDDKVCKTSETAPACTDIFGNKKGFWVCRTLTNPFTGNASSKSVCISKGQYLKGNDACGCCEPDGCPIKKKN